MEILFGGLRGSKSQGSVMSNTQCSPMSIVVHVGEVGIGSNHDH
jgi:hypothetical protein